MFLGDALTSPFYSFSSEIPIDAPVILGSLQDPDTCAKVPSGTTSSKGEIL